METESHNWSLQRNVKFYLRSKIIESFIKLQMNWFYAFRYCRTRGLESASILSKVENEGIKKLCQANGNYTNLCA